jgi:hypothetical protein
LHPFQGINNISFVMKGSRGEVFGDSLGISHARNTELESVHMGVWMREMRGRERGMLVQAGIL